MEADLRVPSPDRSGTPRTRDTLLWPTRRLTLHGEVSLPDASLIDDIIIINDILKSNMRVLGVLIRPIAEKTVSERALIHSLRPEKKMTTRLCASSLSGVYIGEPHGKIVGCDRLSPTSHQERQSLPGGAEPGAIHTNRPTVAVLSRRQARHIT